MGLGTRVPGSAAHDRLADALADRLAAAGAEVHVQPFTARFHGTPAACRNVVGVFRCGRPGAPLALLGTHYDTRPIADREPDPALRRKPIPGANDAGSGTAVLLHLLPWLREACDDGVLQRDVAAAFVDAEDLGDIDGNPFSLGAEHLAAHPPAGVGRPDEVVALDMVGGRDMVLDIDAHVFRHPPSRRLAADLFSLGASLDLPPFTREKPRRVQVHHQRPVAVPAPGRAVLPADRPRLPGVAHAGGPAGGDVGRIAGRYRSSAEALAVASASVSPSKLSRLFRFLRLTTPFARSSLPQMSARGIPRFSA